MKNLYDDIPNGYQKTIEICIQVVSICFQVKKSAGLGGQDIFILTDILMMEITRVLIESNSWLHKK